MSSLRTKFALGPQGEGRSRSTPWGSKTIATRCLDTQRKRDRKGRRGLPAGPMPPSEAPTTGVSRTSRRDLPQFHRTSSPKKPVTDFVERRKHPRVSAKLPVVFSIRAPRADLSRFRGRLFRSVSRDISLGGVGILVQDPASLELAAGCQLTLRISLPQTPMATGCLGELRIAVKGKGGQGSGHLCVQFKHLDPEQDRSLRKFVSA